MPFGKYLESQEMLKRGETPAEGTEARSLALLDLIPAEEPIAVRELGARVRMRTPELREALERLLKLRLVTMTKVGGEPAVARREERTELEAS